MQGPQKGEGDSPADPGVTRSLSDTVRFMRRLGVLASGSGTILQALLDADLPVAVVVVDRSCAAIQIGRASCRERV